MDTNLDSIQRIAALEVRVFVHRAAWAAGHASDMQQEAIIALLSAQGSYSPAKGSWHAFASTTARYAIARYLKRARVTNRAVVMHPLTDEHCSTHAAVAPLPDAQLDSARLDAKLRQLLASLDRSKKKVGLAVALGESPRQVSKRTKVPVEAVYYARAQMMRRAALHPPLKALWKELRP